MDISRKLKAIGSVLINTCHRVGGQHGVTRAALVFGFGMAIAVAGVMATAGHANAQCLNPPGDVNKNGVTDITDLQCAILVSLAPVGPGGQVVAPACLKVPVGATDTNCDGPINISDLVIMVYWAVGLALDPIIDPNANNCPDACEVPGSYRVAPIYASGKSSSANFVLIPRGNSMQATGGSEGTNFKLVPKGVGDQGQ
ncbi:MAG: hypothetical protein HUU55_18020 [Myxococcales bacterium]|nr:hypothetical protein [Myxococcales bacterium]